MSDAYVLASLAIGNVTPILDVIKTPLNNTVFFATLP